jgi:23S rRNA A1618 N6-methylase RlmF
MHPANLYGRAAAAPLPGLLPCGRRGGKRARWSSPGDGNRASQPVLPPPTAPSAAAPAAAAPAWGAPGAAAAVAGALLRRDFALRWALPDGHLAPAVTRSVNYLLWLQDLVALGLLRAPAGAARASPTLALDVGTGASCIFPLLGCRLEPSWRFVASDIDAASVAHARQLVRNNHLEERVEVRHCAEGQYIAAVLEPGEGKRLAFTLCNPPFFASYHENELEEADDGETPSEDDDDDDEQEGAIAGARQRRRRVGGATPASLDFRGTASEKCFTGEGEVGFFRELARDSFALARDARQCWFSCMLGHKASVGPALAALGRASTDAREPPPAVHVTALVQGKRRRWAVAWHFRDDGDENAAAAADLLVAGAARVAAADSLERAGALALGPLAHAHRHFAVPRSVASAGEAARRALAFLAELDGRSGGHRVLLVPADGSPARALRPSDAPQPSADAPFECRCLVLVDDAQIARVHCYFYLRVGPPASTGGGGARAPATDDQGAQVAMDELVLFDTKAALHDLSAQLEQAVLRTSRRWRRKAELAPRPSPSVCSGLESLVHSDHAS